MKKRIRQNIILLAATVIIFILFLEIGFRIISLFSLNFMCATYSNPSEAYLCKLESQLSKSLEKYNQTTGITAQDVCDSWDPQLGWIPKANCKTPKYSTNSKGIRGTKEYSLQKNKKRIAVIGDSFTWGVNNFDNETYPFYLDKLFNGKADVMNMGVEGYGSDQFYIYFTRDGLKYNPDIVIFGLFLPDIHRVIFSVRDYFKPRFIIKNKELVEDPDAKIPDIKTALKMSSEIKKKNRSYLLSYVGGLYNKFIRRATSYRGELPITLKIIEDMNKKLKGKNTELIVLLIPEQEMVEKNNFDYYGVIPQITSNLNENKIEYINLQPVFKKEFDSRKESLYQGHLKPIGNFIIARELFKYINKSGD